MADKTHEFFQSVQKFLMKKEREYGELKFISSRATTETSSCIDQLLQGIIEIFDAYKMIPVDNMKFDPSVKMKSEQKGFIESYRCLLLNTYFHVQPRLAEDILHGHLVGMWPTLSPYLFVQIILGLRYEELITESILHAPLELCIEILEITVKCVTDLEFKRAMHFVTNLIWYIYRRSFMLSTVGTQTENLTERIQYLVANFQMLLEQLMSEQIHMPDGSEAIKYEQHGIVLKNIIHLIKMCTEVRLTDDMPTTSQELYTLTFGSEAYHKLTAESLKSTILILDNELVTLLLNCIKQVDCHMYIAWAEVDDQDNTQLTLQRAIAIECYYFLQFIKNDTTLSENNQLQECLQQLTGSKNLILTLHELCYGIANGRLEDMKELMNRYQEWEESTLDFIYEQWSLLDKDDCQILFQYLDYAFSQYSYINVEKYRPLNTVLKIIMNRCLPDIYTIAITYMIRNFDHNFLESFYDDNHFDKFIRSNKNMRDPLNLRLLLTFVLYNPQRVLTVLIQVAIGCTAYNGVVFTPQDILLIKPFLAVRLKIDCINLTYLLRNICVQQDRWDIKKFTNFVHTMVDTKVTSPDDIINNVFIPYLEARFDKYNINGVLVNIRKMINKCAQNINVVALCTALIRRMSTWRKCDPQILRSMVNEVLANIVKVLDNYEAWLHRMSIMEKQAMMDAVRIYIEPLDRANLTLLMHITRGSVLDIINDYKKRYYANRRELKCRSIQSDHTMPKLGHEDFIRHMFLHCTEMEYQRYSFELAVLFWRFFGWKHEIDAYDNVLHMTMEAARIALECPDKMPCDSFITLFKYAVDFYCTFIKVEHLCDQEKPMLQILLKNLSYLKDSIQNTQYSLLYSTLLIQLGNVIRHIDSQYKHQEFMEPVNAFVAEASQLMEMYEPGTSKQEDILPREDDMHKAYESVCAYISISEENQYYQCIDKIVIADNDNISTIDS